LRALIEKSRSVNEMLLKSVERSVPDWFALLT
jgi:hypothetical protein